MAALVAALLLSSLPCINGSSNCSEASWELTGFGFVGTPKLSELEARAIPGWVTTLGSCSVSSQEQIRKGGGGVGPAQSGQYLARWSWASPLRHSGLRGGLLGAGENVARPRNKTLRGASAQPKEDNIMLGRVGSSPLRHSDVGEAFWELTGFGVVGTPKLSELEAGAIPGWVTTLGSCFVSSQKQNRAGW
ncbi:hypothetical protein L3X38_022614 [Prunus dulcis]|uniref:Uncharacterized protein n=1 Tax=Prunus dulcis TaxID=3755 RepID=A0AAD4Z4H1_PRUDU|nr:hypothetical protein L3X38_022614 [Prunus dulcis]